MLNLYGLGEKISGKQFRQRMERNMMCKTCGGNAGFCDCITKVELFKCRKCGKRPPHQFNRPSTPSVMSREDIWIMERAISGKNKKEYGKFYCHRCNALYLMLNNGHFYEMSNDTGMNWMRRQEYDMH
jgi:hypothetical protein